MFNGQCAVKVLRMLKNFCERILSTITAERNYEYFIKSTLHVQHINFLLWKNEHGHIVLYFQVPVLFRSWNGVTLPGKESGFLLLQKSLLFHCT